MEQIEVLKNRIKQLEHYEQDCIDLQRMLVKRHETIQYLTEFKDNLLKRDQWLNMEIRQLELIRNTVPKIADVTLANKALIDAIDAFLHPKKN